MAVLLAALLVGGLVAPSPGGAARGAQRRAGPALTASPAHPLQDTVSTVRVKLPTRWKRPTELQRKVGRQWKKAATSTSTAKGVVTYSVRVRRTTTYRVVAKAVRHGGRRWPAITSRKKRVSPTLRALLVSHGPDGRPGTDNDGAGSASVSADGRYVTFSSSSPDLYPSLEALVPGTDQVYRYDRSTDSLALVSHARGMTDNAGNGESIDPDISADGRFVVYASYASDLVTTDTNAQGDVFRWDATTGATVKLTKAANGSAADGTAFQPSVSADGEVVSYSSHATNVVAGDDNALSDVFVWRALDGESTLVSETLGGDVGNAGSFSPELSTDGTKIAFVSEASDLVFNDSNGFRDVFRYDLDTGFTALVSVGAGAPAGSISGPAVISSDGRYVAFGSYADNLVVNGSPDNQRTHVFVRDLASGETVWVSRSRTGGAVNGFTFASDVSDDGETVLFTTVGTNVVQGDDEEDAAAAFIWKRSTGRSQLLIRDRRWEFPDGTVYEPDLSEDGRWVAFYSDATDLVPQDRGRAIDAYLWRL